MILFATFLQFEIIIFGRLIHWRIGAGDKSLLRNN